MNHKGGFALKAEKKKFNISGQSLIFICLFIAALAFMLWKCRFGLGGSDEAFYLTIPHRLCLGDELFRDEWHLSQLSAFFTLPFVSLYRAVNGSTLRLRMSSVLPCTLSAAVQLLPSLLYCNWKSLVL